MNAAVVLGGIVEVVVEVVVEVLLVTVTAPGPTGVLLSHPTHSAARRTVSASLRMPLRSHIVVSRCSRIETFIRG